MAGVTKILLSSVKSLGKHLKEGWSPWVPSTQAPLHFCLFFLFSSKKGFGIFFCQILIERRLFLWKNSYLGSEWKFMTFSLLLWDIVFIPLCCLSAKQELLFGFYEMSWVAQIISLGRDEITTNCKFKKNKIPREEPQYQPPGHLPPQSSWHHTNWTLSCPSY